MANSGDYSFDDILADVNPSAVKEPKVEEEVTIDNMEVEEEKEKKEVAPEETEEDKPNQKKEPTKETEENSEDTEVEGKEVKEVKESHYSKVAKALIEKGKWEDVLVGEEGNEKPLSELEDLDEEAFLQIQESQDTFKKEDIETNYISLKDIDERKKKVASLVLKGGDLKEIFGKEENLERFLDPYKGVDIDDENVQKNIYYNFLKQKGYSDKAANFELQEKLKELTLDTEVKSIVDESSKKALEYVSQKEKELEEQNQQLKEEEKEYKKNLSKSLKEKFPSDTLVRKYLEVATKRDEEGDFAIDSIYNEKMKDPATAVDIIELLTDRENFYKRIRDEAKTGASKEALRKVSIIKQKDKKAPSNKKEEGVFDIEMAETP